ncbi:MAG TPA: AlkA N-terminal domain-containing protein [Acidimicrobiales bacterium]|nr:AlkA N-terminal domain-containing protein [Acidimicrobiales bacterium]
MGPDLTDLLPVRPPLEWDAMLAYLALRAIPGVEAVAGATYARTVVVDGVPGVVDVTRAGDDRLAVRARLASDRPPDVAPRVRRIFGLDADPDAAGAVLGGDPLIGPLLAARPGLRVPGTWDGFEIGVRAIVGQQVTVPGASTLAGRLVGRHGERLAGPAPPGLTHTFPPPAALAEGDLDGIGLTQARAGAIRGFAQAVAEGRVRLDRSIPLDELVDSIAALPGLGPWTAQYVALRLGEPDAFPASDLGLRRALADGGSPAALPSARELTERAAAWRPWRALAAIHLWSSGRPAARPE